ncbi:prefoldin subunit 3-like [Octodon degus]|uniref:Prefoldin subunit 3 n=1 Tax=Octodon degus TaxID=10160 RepID=A0A6P3VA55_OCTDE|nr:prefoldin subunit 3-like [Octodon degus]
MKQPGNETADTVLKKLDEQYQKYQFIELNLAQKKQTKRKKGEISDIKQISRNYKIHTEGEKKPTVSLETRFLLHCKASIPPTDKVVLWLGANVMLEYDIDEVQALLEKNLSTAMKNLKSLDEDLDLLRDQFTVTEVNMATVYNWDVKRNKDDSTKNKE